MALVIKDRVKQTTTTTGTGTLTLNGTVDGFQTFAAALSDGDTTYYSIFEPSTNNWEVGLGTWTEGSSLLARTTVLASSNSGSAINLTAQAEVFISQPAGKAAFFSADGDLELNRDPQTALQAATKEYVDTIAAAGLHYHDPVRVEKEGNLSATYDNGTAGVGATLTNNSTQAALVIDGVTLSTSDRVLVYEQTDATQNGVYTVTDTGSASTNWVLTRSTDTDSYAPSDPNSFGKGDAFFVLEGNEGAGELYVMNTEGTITFGTTNITFTQVASTAVYSAGNGLTLTGTVFAADAGTGVTVDGTGINIGQAVETTSDVTFNSVSAALTGNVTGNVTGDVTGNADTATALETARNIGGVSFDGTASINLPGVNTTGNQDTSGNAATATAWETGRTISLTGDVTGSVTGVDGSGNASIATTIAANSVALGTDTTGDYVSTITSGNYLTGGTSGEGSTPTLNVDATPNNTASKVVARDASGNFSAGTITANLTGTASNANTLDSLDSTQFLRSDADDSTSGILTSTNSHSGSGGITVNTNSHAYMSTDRGGTTVQAGYQWKTNGTTNWYNYISTSSAELKWYTTSNVMTLTTSGSLSTTPQGTLWGSSNDGSGSGLDADTVDGYHASQSQSNNTVAVRNAYGYLFSSYYNGTGTFSTTGNSSGMARFTGTNGSDTYGRSYTPDAAKAAMGLATTDSPSFAGLNINGNLNAVDNIYLASTMYHEGDTNTYLTFGTDTITLATGGSSEITVNTTGVRLGDTGNGYFQPVSGDFGSIQIDGGAHGGYEGYSIGGRAVFMHDNGSNTGIYNDADNEWLVHCIHNGAVNLYHNGSNKLQTTSTGANIDGDLNAVDNVYVAGSLIHEGDTDTFINFQNNIIYINAGNSTNFTCATAYTNVNKPLYNYSVYYEDYDALSGTSVTVNCDTAQAFSLTMTGNTTFTFNSVSNPWSTGFVLELTGNGGTVTWPTSVEWAGGTAPDAPASGETDIYVFWTRDGGTTWYGVLSVDAAA